MAQLGAVSVSTQQIHSPDASAWPQTDESCACKYRGSTESHSSPALPCPDIVPEIAVRQQLAERHSEANTTTVAGT